MNPRRLLWLLLPAAVLLLDWASKVWIVNHLVLGGSRPILPGFFHLSLGYNPGFIFGSLGTAAAWVRTTLSVLAGVGAIGYFGYEFLRDGTLRAQRIGLGCIIGGALGNGLDRLQHGAVVDFLDFIFFGWRYPTFNIADSFIVCGAILWALSYILANARQGKAAAGAE